MTSLSITHQLLSRRLVEGALIPGETIGVTADQVLLQDTNGPMSFLQFEAMGAPVLRPQRVVAYLDHNILQVDPRNSDDHRYLETAAARYGAVLSRAGNGICHQVHLETFSVPGECLVGTDSHTVVCGAVGMLAFGAGSMDVALTMATGIYRLTMPKVVQVRLTGGLRPWASAKDVILTLLRRLSVRGGGGRAFEFTGPGVAGLTVPQRATIANMGAELGLTTSLFPSDETTRAYFAQVGRAAEWRPLAADPGAVYDETIDLDLAAVDVLVAVPSSPDAVVEVGEVAGTAIDQVIVGSCTNGSWEDVAAVAALLRGKQISPSLSVILFPGSRRVLEAMAREGVLSDLLAAGVQIAASGCGACPGLSHVPATGTRSLRTFNRNFPGRSGHREDQIYLCSPAVAAASALTGVITDPRTLGADAPVVPPPRSLLASEGGLLLNADESRARGVQVIRGPNIKEVPVGQALAASLTAEVLLKLGDGISTDHISPVGVQSLLLRTNIPAIAEHSFKYLDPTFVARARARGGGVLVGGEQYGQGSSRETAASGLMVLGIRAILAKSFARIHRTNLVNWGIVPLQFERRVDYDQIEQGDELELPDLREDLARGRPVVVKNLRTGAAFAADHALDPREREVILAGGLLALAKTHSAAR